MGAEVGDLGRSEVAQPRSAAGGCDDPAPAVGTVGRQREQAAARMVPDPLLHLRPAGNNEPQVRVGDRVGHQPLDAQVLGGERAHDRHLRARPSRDHGGQVAVAQRAHRDRRGIPQNRVVTGQRRPPRPPHRRRGRAGGPLRDQPSLLHQAQRLRRPAHRTAQARIVLPGQRRRKPPRGITQPRRRPGRQRRQRGRRLMRAAAHRALGRIRRLQQEPGRIGRRGRADGERHRHAAHAPPVRHSPGAPPRPKVPGVPSPSPGQSALNRAARMSAATRCITAVSQRMNTT